MSRSEVKSRSHYRGSGYGSGSREPTGYVQSSGSFDRRRGPRSITPEYDRPVERDRSRERTRDRYGERDRSRYGSPSRSPGGQYSGDAGRGPRNSLSQRFTPEPSRVLGVFGLNMRTTERDLKKLFSTYGEVEKVVIIYHHVTQQSRRFGFVSFKTLEAANLARRRVNGMEFHGRKIRVDYSVTQRAHSPTPGRYMGRERTQRRSYRPSGYGEHSHDGAYDRYDRRDRHERDRSVDSRDRGYNDRPSSPPDHDDKWDDKKDPYPPRNTMRSGDSGGDGWHRDESD